MSNYDKLDVIGKEKFQEFFNKKLTNKYDTLTFTKNIYAHVDCFMRNNSEKTITFVEIKNRDHQYLRYNDIFLELEKKQYIMDIVNNAKQLYPDYNIQALYFVSYNWSNTIKMLNMTATDFSNYEVEMKMCNKSTAEPTIKVLKPVYIIKNYIKTQC